MKLEGSCHCGSVSFSLDTNTPYPYQRCYCSICRKTAGGGGYAINIMGWAETLEVTGEEHIQVYNVRKNGETSPLERRFCGGCGSALWVYHDKWPELVHPFASAIDTPLPRPLDNVHIMLDFKAEWVEVPEGPEHSHFDRYPDNSIEVWHDSMQQNEPDNSKND